MTQYQDARPKHPMPFTRLEVCVLGLNDQGLHVLLGKREAQPYQGHWALPGGVLRIDLDEDLEGGARRVMHERLALELPFMRQLVAVGGKHRDHDRSPWALSVVYRALVWQTAVQPLAGKRLSDLAWRGVEDAVTDTKLAFDHRELVALAVERTRQEVADLELPVGFLPRAFTLGELQSICERILGRALDKSSFRRKLSDRGLVHPIEGEKRGGANRPAQLFELSR
ncbi:NUDIX domain-containing protein [Inhella crocodyli]|uniref:NUDIX domain-containing protein n=1 Tax=Inhella crocodyli TaxID=2499851 RepID=A0A3S2XZF9_9BURK|nr:NUDIX domain-containing protein [Inhella crocodyli]RVT88349.1 NUDIX domain-containing protein [Inhella crocodyli]